MKEETFYISVKNEQLGPFTITEIMSKFDGGEISTTDYIYVQEKDDWILLVEHPGIIAALKSNKPSTPPPMASKPKIEPKVKATSKKKKTTAKKDDFEKLPDNPMLTEWYILKGENKFGPFQYTEVIKMLQEKVVFEFDFAWKNNMETWTRIAEIQAFRPEHIEKLRDSLMPEIKTVFFRRKHPRLPFEGHVIIHDNNDVWKGKGVEISAGGAGLIMENSLVVPGQTLYMHFKPKNGLPAFNAICEVVSKKFIDGVRNKSENVCYGVKFKNLSGSTHKVLLKFTKDGGLAAA